MTTPTPPAAVQMPPLPVVAYARRWHINGEIPAKQKNANGRMAWPAQFKFMEVTKSKVFAEDEPLCKVSDAQAYAAQRCQELEAKLAAAEKRVAVLESENANLLHALKAELQGQTFMGEPFIPALTPKEQQ